MKYKRNIVYTQKLQTGIQYFAISMLVLKCFVCTRIKCKKCIMKKHKDHKEFN